MFVLGAPAAAASASQSGTGRAVSAVHAGAARGLPNRGTARAQVGKSLIELLAAHRRARRLLSARNLGYPLQLEGAREPKRGQHARLLVGPELRVVGAVALRRGPWLASVWSAPT